MQHHVCASCGRDFHRARLLRWHRQKHCAIPSAQPEPSVLAARRKLLVEIQARAATLRATVEESAAEAGPTTPRRELVQRGIDRRRVFPPAVPAYRPPFPDRREVDRVKRALFKDAPPVA